LNMLNSDGKEAPAVNDLGQIAIFRLPAGWKEVLPEKSEWADQSYSCDFSPVHDPSALLSVYFRGSPVSEGTAERFHQLLRQPAHKLCQTEINSINQVLSKLADEDAFQMNSIETANINGRQALVVDGEWKTSQTQFHGLMIVDESGREIQEVFFEAPVAGFMKYLNEVVEAIRTIEWKGL
jgi:hypothetical protein